LQGNSAEFFLQQTHYIKHAEGIWIDPHLFPTHRKEALLWVIELLRATLKRPNYFACFGLHEWAMVYKAEKNRHAAIPLRLSEQDITDFVNTQSIVCSHYDAFRFFTSAARPLNQLQPQKKDPLSSPLQLEQGGCLHANMDLYKWAFKFFPYVSSELLLATFLLAKEIRTLDMQASPYDLSSFGYAPICIETLEGKAIYVQKQKEFALRAQQLRRELLTKLQELADASSVLCKSEDVSIFES
jgi:hypothetical protein